MILYWRNVYRDTHYIYDEPRRGVPQSTRRACAIARGRSQDCIGVELVARSGGNRDVIVCFYPTKDAP